MLGDKLLLESLGKYETKLGILRSKPNPVLAKLHARDSLMETPLSGIDRNAASDTYYTSLWLSDSVSKKPAKWLPPKGGGSAELAAELRASAA